MDLIGTNKASIIGLQTASCLGIIDHIWLYGSEQTEETSHLKHITGAKLKFLFEPTPVMRQDNDSN